MLIKIETYNLDVSNDDKRSSDILHISDMATYFLDKDKHNFMMSCHFCIYKYVHLQADGQSDQQPFVRHHNTYFGHQLTN